MGFINQLITGGHHPVGGLPCSDPTDCRVSNFECWNYSQFSIFDPTPHCPSRSKMRWQSQQWGILGIYYSILPKWFLFDQVILAILIIFGTEVSNFALCKIFNNLSFQNSKWIGTWTTLPSWWQVPAAGTCYLKGFKWATLEPFIIPVAPKSW